MALKESAGASDPSTVRGRVVRVEGAGSGVSSSPGPLAGSASVARLASWGLRLTARSARDRKRSFEITIGVRLSQHALSRQVHRDSRRAPLATLLAGDGDTAMADGDGDETETAPTARRASNFVAFSWHNRPLFFWWGWVSAPDCLKLVAQEFMRARLPQSGGSRRSRAAPAVHAPASR